MNTESTNQATGALFTNGTVAPIGSYANNGAQSASCALAPAASESALALPQRPIESRSASLALAMESPAEHLKTVPQSGAANLNAETPDAETPAAEPSGDLCEHRLGKSHYWLKFTREEHGLSSSWRMNAWQKPPRAPKRNYAIPLLDISPQHPLLTLALGEESFPLLIENWDAERPGLLTLSGQRKLSSDGQSIAVWNAKVRVRSSGAQVALDFDLNVRVTPPPKQKAALRIGIGVPIFRPYVRAHPTAARRGEHAIAVWSDRVDSVVTFVAPEKADPERRPWTDRGALTCAMPEIGVAGRGTISFSVALKPARTIAQAHGALVDHYALVRPLALPEPEPWRMTLREAAGHAIALITDKGSYDVKGTERVYLRPPILRAALGNADRPSYFAGFPYFPTDAARAMVDWNALTGDEPARRLAALAARGVAADFAVMAREGECHSNKGAFWDRLTLPAESIMPRYSNAYGDDSHGIVSSARIARALFEIFAATNDNLFRQAALNTCHWLMLKQNGEGYYDGDHIHGSRGSVFGGANLLAGAEAIRPLVMAFRTTSNEVFIKSAWKIADHLLQTLVPELSAPAFFTHRVHGAEEHGPAPDSPVAVASLILALLDLDAEAPNKRLHDAVHMAGAWLRSFRFDPEFDPDLDYDGMSAGLYECAQAAILMFNLERDPAWLQLGLRAVRSVPIDARISWRSVPAFLLSLLGLVPLMPGGQIDWKNRTAKIKWSTFGLDAATIEYVSVTSRNQDDPVPVDFLPLVCRQDDHMLLLALSAGPVDQVIIKHNQRNPVVRDLVTKELVQGPACLHRLPFGSKQRYGLFTIAP